MFNTGCVMSHGVSKRGGATLAPMPDDTQRDRHHRSKAQRRADADASSGQRELKKHRIRESLLSLLMDGVSIHSVSLGDVAERAGLNRTSLYHYVSSKEQLFRAALGLHLDAHFAHVDLELREDEEFGAWVARVLDDIIELWVTSAPLMRASASLADADDAHHDWVESRTAPWRRAFEAAARTAAMRGETTAPADIPVAAAVAMWSVQGSCAAALGRIHRYAPGDRAPVLERFRMQLIVTVRTTLGAAR